jgi:hypothetical protein
MNKKVIKQKEFDIVLKNYDKFVDDLETLLDNHKDLSSRLVCAQLIREAVIVAKYCAPNESVGLTSLINDFNDSVSSIYEVENEKRD